LKCPRKPGSVRVDHSDQNRWWYLYNTAMPWKKYPMGFTTDDACEAATLYLESREQEAEAMKALLEPDQHTP
jgi:phage/plasmid-associated DNA primase